MSKQLKVLFFGLSISAVFIVAVFVLLHNDDEAASPNLQFESIAEAVYRLREVAH